MALRLACVTAQGFSAAPALSACCLFCSCEYVRSIFFWTVLSVSVAVVFTAVLGEIQVVVGGLVYESVHARLSLFLLCPAMLTAVGCAKHSATFKGFEAHSIAMSYAVEAAVAVRLGAMLNSRLH